MEIKTIQWIKGDIYKIFNDDKNKDYLIFKIKEVLKEGIKIELIENKSSLYFPKTEHNQLNFKYLEDFVKNNRVITIK